MWLGSGLGAEADRAAAARESRVDRRESREHDVTVGRVVTLLTRGREAGESGGYWRLSRDIGK